MTLLYFDAGSYIYRHTVGIRLSRFVLHWTLCIVLKKVATGALFESAHILKRVPTEITAYVLK